MSDPRAGGPGALGLPGSAPVGDDGPDERAGREETVQNPVVTAGPPTISTAPVPPSATGAAPPAVPASPAPGKKRRRKRRSWRRWVITILATPLVLALVATAAFAVDASAHDGQVVRNVDLGDLELGSLGEADLVSRIDGTRDELAATPVEIDAGDFELTTTAGELGIDVDVDATVERILEIGRDDPLPERLLRWIASFTSHREAELRVSFDQDVLEDTLVALEGERHAAPVEPTLVVSGEGVAMTPGEPGEGIDARHVMEAIQREELVPGRRIRVSVEQHPIPTQLADSEVQEFAERATRLTSGTIDLHAADQVVQLDATRLRAGMQVDPNDGSLTLEPSAVNLLLAGLFPSGSGNTTGVTFSVENGAVVIVPGQPAEVCCADDSADRILAALEAGETSVELATVEVSPDAGLEWAQGLGITTLVGEFTTNHPCCEARVTNIHRIADLVRGVVIEPGETFSVNDFTGPRDVANGFVPAPVIIDGEHEIGVGGGVSQFATTLFNAAFFGGLDFGEYQSHSEFISRYPYGREATMFYPQVDLEIVNSTPYGVLIWTAYTDRSLTVQLWSTPYARGEQTGQSQSSGCGSVTTQRTRTFVDGHQEVDEVYAYYRC